MHVVEVRHALAAPRARRRSRRLLRASAWRRSGASSASRSAVSASARSSGTFAHDGPILHAADERRPEAARDAQARHRDVVTERIGDEIDGVSERRQRANAMELGERRAPRLEERLRRDHQDVHQVFARCTRSGARARGPTHERPWYTTRARPRMPADLLPSRPLGPDLDAQDRRQRRAAVRPALTRGSRTPLDDRAHRVASPGSLSALLLYFADGRRQRVALGPAARRAARRRRRSAGCSTRSSSRRSSTTSSRRTSAATSSASATPSRAAGSKTLATTVVLVDRGIGLLGLVFVAAVGATLAARMSEAIGPLGPGVLWLMLAGAIAVGDAGAADAAARRHSCFARCARCTRSGSTSASTRLTHALAPLPEGAAGARRRASPARSSCRP